SPTYSKVPGAMPAFFERSLRSLRLASPFFIGSDFQVAEQYGGKITLAVGGDDYDDELALVLGAPCHLERRPYRRPRGNADQQALFQSHTPRGLHRVLVLHAHDFIIDRGVENLRHKAGAYALD